MAGALQGAPRDEHLHFERLTPRQGLPAATVYCIFEDSRGFLWFGTADGVARYDGQQFLVFKPVPGDAGSLTNACVLAIQEDPDGNLWMATEGDLALWHRDTERFTHYRHDPKDPSSLSDSTTQSLWRDADGTLWVGTKYGGLNHFDPRTGRSVRYEPAANRSDTVNDPWIRCLYRDSKGVLWIGTGDGGLNCLDPTTGKFRAYRHRPGDPLSLSNDRINAISEDAQGTLWVGTDNGLCSLNRERTAFKRYRVDGDVPGVLHTQTISALMIDREGTLWVGTDGAGFCRFDPKTGQVLRHRYEEYAGNSLMSDSIRAVLEDRAGDFWIGHFPAGVSHFDRQAAPFQVFSREPGVASTLSDDHVLAFQEDADGGLWVGTDNGGLNHWSADRGWTNYPYDVRDPSSLGAKAAVCVLRDHRGELWVGTWDGGLSRLVPGTRRFRRYATEPGRADSLTDMHVWQLVEDHRGRMWVATIGGGVNRYVPETDSFVHFRYSSSDPRSINDDIVSAMTVTKEGDLWVGTPKGLARWDESTQSWQRFQDGSGHDRGSDGYWIFDIVEASDGIIWSTSEGGGLFRLDPRTGESKVFRMADGLPSDVLRGMLMDSKGRLWIGSNEGLIRFNPRTKSIRVFDESNGLPSGLFAPHARLRLASGEFLFGTTRGFVRFDPSALKTDDKAPPVVLTSFEIFNREMRPGVPGSPLTRSISETHLLRIPYSLSVFSLQFAALSYRSPERIQYRYRLVGFDNDWRTPGPERRATFTNLDPGHYRFLVKAANSDGIWNQAGVSLDIIIVPLWWQTLWAKLLLVLLVLGAAASAGWAISAHRAREALHKQRLAVERERVREREEVADSLRTMNQDLERRVQERTAQIQLANKELEAFSYSVSHDLRAPLRNINGFSRILLEDNRDRLDPASVENIRIIRASTQRMGQLIDDMLMLAKVTRTELRRSEIDLSAMAASIAAEVSAEYPSLNVELIIQPGLTAHADHGLIQAVLHNLLANAWKFSSRQASARIEFGREDTEDGPAFFVRDNGAGFAPEYAHKLFKAFQRLHSREEFSGTGVGLATVQRIIQRHGGRVWASSSPGNGAVFHFTLPTPDTPHEKQDHPLG